MSSNATPVLPGFRLALSALALGLAGAAFAQQDAGSAQTGTGATAATDAAPSATPTPTPAPQPTGPINLVVSRPRSEAGEAQLRECRSDAEASTISGEIVVCRKVDEGDQPTTGDREFTRKRYAQETMNKGKPAAPDLFGIPDNGKGIGFGKAPPVAITVDFAALPTAPAGSDADRIAQGLAPLGKDEELTEEQERARREAEGIQTTVPARPGKKKKGG